jgi:hypothetical protein
MIETYPGDTLYHQLGEADSASKMYADWIEESMEPFDDINERLRGWGGPLGLDLGRVNVNVEVPELDTPQIQKRLIERYDQNWVLKRALAGDQSVEERLTELEEEGKWNRMLRYLPRRKDQAYNMEVSELGQLIPAGHMFKRGLLKFDNFTGAFGGGGLGVPLLVNAIGLIGEIPSLPHQVMAAVVGLVFGSAVGRMQHSKYRAADNFKEGREAAQYLDNKLGELGFVS